MPDNVDIPLPSIDPMLLPDRGMIELDAASIAAVAGGLNPQPLPPGRIMRLD